MSISLYSIEDTEKIRETFKRKGIEVISIFDKISIKPSKSDKADTLKFFAF